MEGRTVDEGRIIWTRVIDWEAQRARRQKFLRFYVGPSVAALVVALLVGGFWAMLGVLIFLGLVGLLLGAWVEMTNFNLRSNRELRVEGRELVLGKRRIELDRVRCFTTHMRTASTMVGGSYDASSEVGVAVFFLPDGQTDLSGKEIDLVWPKLEESELEPIREALEAELPGKGLTLEAFRDPETRRALASG